MSRSEVQAVAAGDEGEGGADVIAPCSCACHVNLMLLRLKVASLHGLGGPLAGCCAVSYGRSLVVYSTRIAPGDIPKPKAHWQVQSWVT